MPRRLLLGLLFANLAVGCSDKPGPVLGGNNVQDMATDMTMDQGMDVNLDQNNSEPDIATDMIEDASDMVEDITQDSSDMTVDANDLGPDDSMPIDLSCSEHGDCSWCAFPTAPQTVDDCYCTGCGTVVMPAAACQANQDAWETVCGTDRTWQPNGACPVVRCVAPKPTACINEMCIDACTQAACPVLNCPVSEQVTAAGECCARCTGPETCTDDSECALCVHADAPANASECECPLCPTHPTTQTECQARQTAFNTHCDADFLSTCPVALCLPTTPPTCGDGGYCERSPYSCQADTDCGYCPFAVAPTNASECVCQGCGVPMTTDECGAIMQQVNEVCDGFNFNACIPPPCAAPPELVCDFFGGGVCMRDL